VDKRFVLPLFLSETALSNTGGSHLGREALINRFHGDGRERAPERPDKPTYMLGRLGFGTIQLTGLAHHKRTYRFVTKISFHIRQHILGMHRIQSRSNKLQRVGHRDADPFCAVIESHNAHPAKVRYLTFTSTLIFPTLLPSYSCRAFPIT